MGMFTLIPAGTFAGSRPVLVSASGSLPFPPASGRGSAIARRVFGRILRGRKT
jgi:hypothetical protein